MKDQQLIKGLLFGIPIGMALAGCGAMINLTWANIFQAAALYTFLVLADWWVRTKNQKLKLAQISPDQNPK